MELETGLIVLALITLLGATINGALGYGFSSTTVPVALLFFTNRILNPALVLIEVVINIYVVFVNRKSIANVWKKALPVLLELIPGVLLGSVLLFWVNADWLKLVTFSIILPLILLQAAGIRRPIRPKGLHERRCLVCGVWALKGLNRIRPSGKFTCLRGVGGGSFSRFLFALPLLYPVETHDL